MSFSCDQLHKRALSGSICILLISDTFKYVNAYCFSAGIIKNYFKKIFSFNVFTIIYINYSILFYKYYWFWRPWNSAFANESIWLFPCAENTLFNPEIYILFFIISGSEVASVYPCSKILFQTKLSYFFYLRLYLPVFIILLSMHQYVF